ncbi:MAG: NAD(P)-dependent oxidoreductase [Candidatus Nanopelagicales bacterium]
MNDATDAHVDRATRILVTGGNGFVGSRVVRALLEQGFTNLVCVTRSADGNIQALAEEFTDASIDIVVGNLLSAQTCEEAARGAEIVYHLAAGMGRTFPACVLNSVVTTRNLLDAVVAAGTVRRFVNVSSMSVYANAELPRGGRLVESSPLADETELALRQDPYAYAKAMQDRLVTDYSREKGLPVVTVRPGFVIGPGKPRIPGRVGNDAFGIFLNVGPRNEMPFTYVENCADAIVAAGLAPDVDGEVFIVVDDDRPTSAEYLRLYKKRVGWFPTVRTPYSAYLGFTSFLEWYSTWSDGQIPPTYNRRSTQTYFKGNTYSNEKAKQRLGWRPRVPMDVSLERCFDYMRAAK